MDDGLSKENLVNFHALGLAICINLVMIWACHTGFQKDMPIYVAIAMGFMNYYIALAILG